MKPTLFILNLIAFWYACGVVGNSSDQFGMFVVWSGLALLIFTANILLFGLWVLTIKFWQKFSEQFLR